MRRLKRKIVATCAGATLIVLGLPATALAQPHVHLDSTIVVATPKFATGGAVRVGVTHSARPAVSNDMRGRGAPELSVSVAADKKGLVLGDDLVLTATVNIPDTFITWQSRKGNGAWSNEPYATGQRVTVNPTKAGADIQYRAVATGSVQGSVASEPVVVKVDPKLFITDQPRTMATYKDVPVTFRVGTEPSDAQVQWQKQTDSAGKWVDIPDATSASYTLNNPVKGCQDRFRAVVTYKKYADRQQKETSASAGYVVRDGLIPDMTYPADVNAIEGDSVSLTSKFNQTTNVTYQWQRYNPVSDRWFDVLGAVAKDYTFTATMADNHAKYRVLATLHGDDVVTSSDYSRHALIRVQPRVEPTSGKDLDTDSHDDTVEKGDNVGGDASGQPDNPAGGSDTGATTNPAGTSPTGATTNPAGTSPTGATTNPAGTSPTGANTKVSLATTGADSLLIASMASVLIAGGAMVMLRRRRTVA